MNQHCKPVAVPPATGRDETIKAATAAEQVSALLKVARDLLDDFPHPVSPGNCEVIDKLNAVLAGAAMLNEGPREFLNGQC